MTFVTCSLALSNIIKAIKSGRVRWVGACSTHRGDGNAYKILFVKPEGKRLLGRPRRGWEDITIDHKEIRWEGVNWISSGRVGTNGRLL
jgi:hypothetical protein